MLIRLWRLAVATTVAACLLTGCQPATTPTPTPAPSYSCTPEAGGDEFSCSQHQYDEMVAKDKLYAEAEQVYRRFMTEDSRILQAGGVTQPTVELLATTSGAFLDDAMATYKDLRKGGVRASGEQPVLKYFRRIRGVSKAGSVVAASTCVDGTGLKFMSGSEMLGRGQISLDHNYFGLVDGQLKLVGADGTQVGSCE